MGRVPQYSLPVRTSSLIMQVGLVLLLSLFIVYVRAKDDGKGAELKSIEILGNSVSREAKKQKQNKNKIKQSSKHSKGKIQKKKNNGKINGEHKSRKEKNKNAYERKNKSKQANR